MKNKLRIGAATLAALVAGALNLPAATYTVTTTADAGPGSLRQAILSANANPGPDSVEFAIGAGAAVLQPTSRLPAIIDRLILDGRTQPGFKGTPLVHLDGKLAGASADGLTFGSGASGSVVRSLAISTFDGAGIAMTNLADAIITGCHVGTDASGTSPGWGNRRGIVLSSCSRTGIGDPAFSDSNTISGNREEGVLIEGEGMLNRVDGNRIGTDSTGANPLPNGGDGVRFLNGPKSCYVQRNLIAFNGGAGVNVLAGLEIGLYQNSFKNNALLGIDLGGDGVTFNDAGDLDDGPNRLQNFPELTRAESDGSNLTVTGTLASTPNDSFAVEYFWSEVCDPKGHGEGRYLARFIITTTASGAASFTHTFAAPGLTGGIVLATATQASGDTSEFSKCLPVTPSATTCLDYACPTNLSFPCGKPEGAVVQYAQPAGTNRCTGEPIVWSCHPPPGTFPPGVTTVACWGPVLENGEAAHCEFTVSVATNCPAVPSCLSLHCPGEISVPCEAPAGATVNYTFTATNSCQGQLAAYCIPPSGSVFEPGITLVQCTAIGNGQTNRCSFKVSVTGDCAPQLRVTQTPNGLILAWSALARGYVPQETAALGPEDPVWTLLTGPVTRIGDENQMFILRPTGPRYYSLVRPLTPRPTFSKPASTVVDAARSRSEQVVLKFREGTGIRLRGGALTFDAASLNRSQRALLRRAGLSVAQVAADVSAIRRILERYPGTVVERLVVDLPETILGQQKSRGEGLSGNELADLDLYFNLLRAGATAASASALINELNAVGSVEIAYAQPIVTVPSGDIPPVTTFVISQNHLNPAPVGIDARCAWSFPGGRGGNTRVIDVEGNWHLDHEDLPLRGPFFRSGLAGDWFDETRDEHGTAVLGVLVACDNGFGATGIVPEADFGVAAFVDATILPTRVGVPAAIANAASALRAGDVILLELQSVGPATGGACPSCNCSQFEHVPTEFFPADWDAIFAATGLGIIVVEAAANGSVSLSNPAYLGRMDPADPRFRDSGAIVVGASSGGGDLSTACFSNSGGRVDVHAWGGGVGTLGYGFITPAGAGDDPRQRYNPGFGGTSSASPIVAGTVLALQGILRERGLPPLTPDAMRSLLRDPNNGTPQPSGETRPIGSQPDLAKLIGAILPDGAAFVSQSVPDTMTPGALYPVSITLRNSGREPWPGGGAGLRPQNPANSSVWGVSEVRLPTTVNPGTSFTFNFTVAAPFAAGTVQNFQWRLVRDGARFIGCDTPGVEVRIGAPPAFSVLEPTRFAGDPVVIADGNQRLHVFALGLGGQILHSPQLGPGLPGPWQPRTPTAFGVGNLAAARNRDNRLEVFGRRPGLEPSYRHIFQTSPGIDTAWSGVEAVGDFATFGSDPAAGVNQDGRLELFGANADGSLSHVPQVLFAGGPFGLWSSLDGSLTSGPVGTPSVLTDRGGRLHVFVRWTGLSIRHRAQNSPGGAWGAWEEMGGPRGTFATSSPVAAVNALGRLEVYVRGFGQRLYVKVQDNTGTFPADWRDIGSPPIGGSAGRPGVASNSDNRLELFVTGEDGGVYRSVQRLDSTMSWPGTWTYLGGTGVRSDPAAERNAAGEIEVFVRGSDDKLWHRRQAAPGVWR